MTIQSSDAVRAALSTNAKELSKAREDLCLHERLAKAKAEVSRLIRLGDELTIDLHAALAEEDTGAKADANARIGNLTIDTSYPDALRTSGVTNARFSIRWEALTYDFQTRHCEWKAQTCDSLPTLSEDVYAHLMASRPDAIPSLIMDLAPGDPSLAMDRYFNALRRGHS